MAPDFGKWLVAAGLVIASIGVLMMVAGNGALSWFGRLPGDVAIRRGNFSFYFPIATCFLISFALTLLAWIFRRFF